MQFSNRLIDGAKRLVFLDSRSRAEELAALLRQLGIDTFVTHSSLSPEQDLRVPISDEAIRELKFSVCLPRDVAQRALELRLADEPAIRSIFAEPVRYVG